jgi:thiol-disulfide isomerase/thioredoxin
VTKQKSRQQRRAEERQRGARLQSRPKSQTSRTPLLLGVGAVALVVALIGALVIVKALQGSSKPAAKSGLAPAAVVRSVSTIPASTFDTIGYQPGVSGFKHIPGTPVKRDGKPLVVYLGADYCPYCAAERWPLVAALSRFGRFTNLGATHSSSTDVYPNTATFSFHGSSYTSRYLTFNPVELYTNQPKGNGYAPLDSPTALEDSLVSKSDPGGTIPFIYLGNHVESGASYNPQILSGMTMSQIAAAMRNPVSTQSQAILGTANLMTAALCQQTGGAPTNVCTAPGVAAAAKHLPSS